MDYSMGDEKDYSMDSMDYSMGDEKDEKDYSMDYSMGENPRKNISFRLRHYRENHRHNTHFKYISLHSLYIAKTCRIIIPTCWDVL